MGWLLLALLTTLALFAAAALAMRTKPEGRAELGIATALFFTLLTSGPIYVLGYSNTFYSSSLAALSLASSVAVLAIAGRRNVRAFLKTCASALGDLERAVRDGLNESLRAKSLVFIGLLWCLGIVFISLVLTWFITVNGWDDFLYHTPIMGFAIQHHGFRVVDMPHDMSVQGTNGYPRLCESTALWFVCFTDRTLVELPAALYTYPLMLGMYALARRYTNRVHAMGLAVVMLLIPHVWHTMCSTYNDLEVAFFFVAALYYASRPVFRLEDALLATLAMTFAMMSKITWLVFVPPIALVACVRLFWTTRSPMRAKLAVLAIGILSFAIAAALHIGRNLLAFDDPFWPFSYENERLGIHWIGFRTYSGVATDPPLIHSWTPPSGGMGDMFHRGYGQAVAWIGFPLAAIAIAWWLYVSIRDVVRTKRIGETWTLGALLFPALVSIKTSPTLMQPRYNTHIVAALLTAGAWVLQGGAWRRAREGLLGAMMALSVIPFFWLGDANYASLDEEKDHLLHPFASRAYSEHPGFDLLAKQKYAEIHAGDEVDFSDDVAFIGALWNFDFSNRVVYVPFRTSKLFLDELAQHNAKWVCVRKGSAAQYTVERDMHWTIVGPTTDGLPEIVYRRR